MSINPERAAYVVSTRCHGEPAWITQGCAAFTTSLHGAGVFTRSAAERIVENLPLSTIEPMSRYAADIERLHAALGTAEVTPVRRSDAPFELDVDIAPAASDDADVRRLRKIVLGYEGGQWIDNFNEVLARIADRLARATYDGKTANEWYHHGLYWENEARDAIERNIEYRTEWDSAVERANAAEHLRQEAAAEVLKLQAEVTDVGNVADEWKAKYQTALAAWNDEINLRKFHALQHHDAQAECDNERHLRLMIDGELTETRKANDTLQAECERLRERDTEHLIYETALEHNVDYHVVSEIRQNLKANGVSIFTTPAAGAGEGAT